VLPQAAGIGAVRMVLEVIAASGLGSFLAVLKPFGFQESLFSFPCAGYTLALDFPLTSQALSLMMALDRLVAGFGGRVYLAKDARTTPAMIARGYPGLERFRAIRKHWNPEGRFSSLLAERLAL
jgi:hypothetical protein